MFILAEIVTNGAESSNRKGTSERAERWTTTQNKKQTYHKPYPLIQETAEYFPHTTLSHKLKTFIVDTSIMYKKPF